MKMHMTGMENFNMQSKRTGIPTSNASTTGEGDSRTISTKSNMLEAMKGNKKGTPGTNASMKQVGAGGQQYPSKNPGTANMDQREKKIYEIYASGKSSIGPIGQQFQGPQQNQNSFLQNKYQFATYYGQKSGYQPGVQQPSAQGQGNLMGGQYEYAIDGSTGPGQQQKPAASKAGAANATSSSLPKRTPHSELTSY